MKLKAYLLHNHAAPFQRSPNERDWIQFDQEVDANLALESANSKGWVLQCPYAFEATWNGGAKAEDIEIRWDEAPVAGHGFVQSHLGDGLLTLHPGYQFKTEEDQLLWVRGPLNCRPKDGLTPLEQIVDTSLFPSTVTINWKFTHPNQTIRFEAGEPFCTIFPYPKNYIENFVEEMVGVEDDPEAFEQAFQQLVQDPAVQNALQNLSTGSEAVSSKQVAPAPLNTMLGYWADQLFDAPPVSCICPTYGRVDLLEEAIYAFLQQDYPGPKELIILNDYDGQTLEFDHPEVRIINRARRFQSIGEKYNVAMALCSYDIIFVWHDDDIYMPHRLSFSVANFDQDKGFFKADRAWIWNNGQLKGMEHNLFHGGSCWHRDLFTDLDGYPHTSNAYDFVFEQRCKENYPEAIQLYEIQPEHIYYIYRWAGTGSYHLSAINQNGQSNLDITGYIQTQATQGQIKQGQIKLHPKWNMNYVRLVQDFLENGQVDQTDDEALFLPASQVIAPPQPAAEKAAQTLFKGTYPAKISVILAASNESALLQRTVDQFEATLPANSEIIVVDNGSTDGCADFLVERERDNVHVNNVHLIRVPLPMGASEARNRGLTQAQGEVIIFADAHIDLPQNWWQSIVARLNRPNVGIVGPGIGVMGKPKLPAALGQGIPKPDLRPEWLFEPSEAPHPVLTLGGVFMALHHDTLKQAGAFDTAMPEWGSADLELCLRYWLLGYEVWVVPDVTVWRNFRKTNSGRVEAGDITSGLLRLAMLHFNQKRMAKVMAALKNEAKFDKAIAHVVDSDVWQQRAAFAASRVRDDEWLFNQFEDSCFG